MKICLFAGTTEGRRIVELLREAEDISLTVCVATQYGEFSLDKLDHITVHTGRMDAHTMGEFFSGEGFSLIVDATHPYAEVVTENIKQAASACGLEYLRILREEDSDCCLERAVCFGSAEEAAKYLEKKAGKVLLTTGVKELPFFGRLSRERLWVRVLPSIPSIEACMEEGIEPSHIIAMQGPFSEKMNRCQMEEIGVQYLVTKNSGRAGGFVEKIEAAAKCGVTALVIDRKSEMQGMGVIEAAEYIKSFVGKDSRENTGKKMKIKIIGVGTGGLQCQTLEAQEAIREAGTLIGAQRLLEGYSDKKRVYEIVPENIKRFLEKEQSEESDTCLKNAMNYVILVSGDVGFYSAAKGILEALKSMEECEVICIPGVGCVSYFAAKLQIPWEDCSLISLHGRAQNLLHAVRTSRKVITLTGGSNTVSAVCGKLTEYGFGDVKVTVGQRLSYSDENICSGSARELVQMTFDPLNVLLIENPDAKYCHCCGIADEEFIRGEVPMTKREVRAVTMSYLQPDADSVIYDIGAGTGSVSVECARAAFRGRVYAIEKNPEAIRLIRQNQKKFAVENLILVEGEAPGVLEDMEPPTHVFIGGSSGNLRAILEKILQKNPQAVIVMNTVTLETLSEAVFCTKEMGVDDCEFIEFGVSRGRRAGRYHLMTAQNPVTVIRFQGKRG